MANEQWFAERGGKQIGPMAFAKLSSAYAAGKLRPDDLVWKEGWPEWRRAGDITELKLAASHASRGGAGAVDAGDTYDMAAEPEAAVAGTPTSRLASPRALGYRGPSSEKDGGIVATFTALGSLSATRPWVMFISILLFIMVGIWALVLVGILLMGLAAGGARGGLASLVITGVHALFLLLYFVPALFLMRYANAIGRLNATRSAKDLEAALEAQKAFWKFVGIVTLIIIALYIGLLVLFFLGAAIIGLA